MDENGKTRNILVVDDDQDFLSLTKEFLGALGYDVTETLSPLEAMEIVSKNEFDLIISDLKMPHVSGLTLLEQIRGKGVETPFLLVSGWIDSLTEEAITRKGGTGFVLKPFKLEELEDAVNRALDAG